MLSEKKLEKERESQTKFFTFSYQVNIRPHYKFSCYLSKLKHQNYIGRTKLGARPNTANISNQDIINIIYNRKKSKQK